MEADPVPGGGCGRGWARGGCNIQLRGNGRPRYVQDALRPRYGGGLQGWEYSGYEDDFFEDAYCDGDYCEKGDGCSYDLRKAHRPCQRRPRWMDQQDNMYSHNFGRASFFFRNREEEESWRQWRKERMGQQMGDGSWIGNQQAATSSVSHMVGEERNAGVYTQEAALGELRSLDVLANQDSDSDTSDSETEGERF
ncbi:hypothetical protein XENTR_v10002591 [Xenopus tropicalis]|nr:hypothetical protein XENTR_v10002591 [Xenopus tropicalis]